MRIIGDGGHAKVVRALSERMPPLPDGFLFIAIGDNADRKKEAERRQLAIYTTLIHPYAFVETGVSIGDGTIIMAGAVIQAGASIGKHCIINTGATVDHDCVLGDYVHIAPGAHLCGHVEVGEGSLIGVGVGIAPMCKIPAWILVKARRLEMEQLYAVEQDYGIVAGRG